MDKPIITYGKALYYPHINLTDMNWLKTASLFYKGLSRIVPLDYKTEDNELINRLNEKEEFLTNINPGQYGEDIGFDFLEFAKSELSDEKHRKKLLQELEIIIPKDNSFNLHSEKISSVLQQELPRLGLAKQPKKNNEWYQLEPITGALYMTFLANRLAEKRNIPVVTDNPIFQPLLRGFQREHLRPTGDVAETLASLVINSSIPEDIQNLPISKIVKFRESYDDERHLFYKGINNLVEELRKVDSPDVLKECIESKQKDIEIAVDNLDRVYKSMGISTTTALLGLSVPAFASGLGVTIAAGGIIAVASGKLLSEGLKYYKSRKESPYSYVLLLRNKLKSETLAKQLISRKIIL
jgi:hypothetical protein